MAPLLGLVQMVLAAYLIITLVVGAMDAFHLLRCCCGEGAHHVYVGNP
jgi:hypothetical protein